MKNIKFTHLYIENFGKHYKEPIDSKLGHRVFISGQNKVGKSTIKRALQWILGAKDENGKEITGIRPHDESGVDIDGLTTVAEIGVSVDGLENTLKRVCFQEKNRQGEYTGKDNLQYFVDDVRKGTKKAYDEFVSGFLPSMVCISAQEFLMKDTAGRREMLSVFSEHDTDSVIDENPEFEPLRAKVKANSVTDLKKACRDKIKSKTKERDGYPARIDEIEKQKVDIDVAELELLKNSLNEQISENKEKQADISKQFEEIDEQTGGILELKLELNGLQQQANLDLEKKRREIRTEINMQDSKLKDVANKAYSAMRDIKRAEENIKRNTTLINATRENWKSANERVFDDSSLVCSYCGQEYPEDKKEQLRANFESHKADELTDLTKRGNELKNLIDSDKKDVERLKKLLEKYEGEEAEVKGKIEKAEKELEELPDSIDISDREDVKKLKQQIAEKEAAMQKSNSAGEIRQRLQDECEDLQSQLNEVNNKLSLAQKNVEIDERISDLKKQQMQLSQEIADIERELDLLKQFERKKAELLESDVNKHFELVKFKMFREMQNGEFADICSPFVNGTSYDGNLNTSDKLLAEVDICLAFQKFYDMQMPVILDNTESIDDDRIPNIPNQLIILQKNKEPQLTIKNLED